MEILEGWFAAFGLSSTEVRIIVGAIVVVLLLLVTFVIVVLVRRASRRRMAKRVSVIGQEAPGQMLGAPAAAPGAPAPWPTSEQFSFATGVPIAVPPPATPPVSPSVSAGHPQPGEVGLAGGGGADPHPAVPASATPSPPWGGVSPLAPPSPSNDTVPIAPLGGETETEYARLAAEPFQAPPAVPLGLQRAPERFSWTAASRPTEAESAPAAVPPPVHPAAAPAHPLVAPAVAPSAPPAPPAAPAATAVPEPSQAAPQAVPAAPPQIAPPTAPAVPQSSAPSAVDDDLDRTVLVPRAPAFDWVLELPDGSQFALAPDTIVGRKPDPAGPVSVLVIPDATRTLSKTHARLRFEGGAWSIEDLGSTNGVLLIDERGAEHLLEADQPVRVSGRVLLGTLEVRVVQTSGGRA